MPITQSAKKALRVSKRKAVFNVARKVALQKATRELKRAILAKDSKKAKETLSVFYKAVDKAAKRGIIKKNAAARKKARAAKLVKKLS